MQRAQPNSIALRGGVFDFSHEFTPPALSHSFVVPGAVAHLIHLSTFLLPWLWLYMYNRRYRSRRALLLCKFILIVLWCWCWSLFAEAYCGEWVIWWYRMCIYNLYLVFLLLFVIFVNCIYIIIWCISRQKAHPHPCFIPSTMAYQNHDNITVKQWPNAIAYIPAEPLLQM